MVRRARAEDATDAAQLLCESITELCVTDHQNDAATLSHWLSNKTPERLQAWIANPEQVTLIAASERELLGIGLVTSKGEVQLCYLRPSATKCGAGGAILRELEQVSRELGLSRVFLTSTSLARGFYEHAGYQATGPGRAVFGTVVGYPYVKVL